MLRALPVLALLAIAPWDQGGAVPLGETATAGASQAARRAGTPVREGWTFSPPPDALDLAPWTAGPGAAGEAAPRPRGGDGAPLEVDPAAFFLPGVDAGDGADPGAAWGIEGLDETRVGQQTDGAPGQLGLVYGFLSTPLGEQALALVAEVLNPVVDYTGEVHFSFFGYGDFTLPQRRGGGGVGEPSLGEPRPAAWPQASLGAAPPPQPDAFYGVRGDERPVSLSAFTAELLGGIVEFLTNPFTVLATLFGTGVYVALRLSFEHRRVRTRSERHRRGSHRPRRRTRVRLPRVGPRLP